MKKLNYITILSLAAGLTFAGNAAADDQEYVYGIFDKADNFSIADGAWKTTNKSLFQAMGDEAVLTFTLVRNDTGNNFTFGTYTYEGGRIVDGRYVVPEGAKVDQSSMKELQSTDGINFSTDKLNANDVVGLYVTDAAGHTTFFDPHYYNGAYHQQALVNGLSYSDFYTVDNQLATSSWAVYNTGETDDPKGTYSIFFDTDAGNYPGPFYYGDPNTETWPARADIRLQVTGYASAASEPPVTPASGGPLPGVWATIALAGAASAYLKRRRKENK